MCICPSALPGWVHLVEAMQVGSPTPCAPNPTPLPACLRAQVRLVEAMQATYSQIEQARSSQGYWATNVELSITQRPPEEHQWTQVVERGGGGIGFRDLKIYLSHPSRPHAPHTHAGPPHVPPLRAPPLSPTGWGCGHVTHAPPPALCPPLPFRVVLQACPVMPLTWSS